MRQSFGQNSVSFFKLTQQISDGRVDISHVLGQQWRSVCEAVVFHQALIQQQLIPVQNSLGETRLPIITIIMGCAGCRPHRLTFQETCHIMLNQTFIQK